MAGNGGGGTGSVKGGRGGDVSVTSAGGLSLTYAQVYTSWRIRWSGRRQRRRCWRRCRQHHLQALAGNPRICHGQYRQPLGDRRSAAPAGRMHQRMQHRDGSRWAMVQAAPSPCGASGPGQRGGQLGIPRCRVAQQRRAQPGQQRLGRWRRDAEQPVGGTIKGRARWTSTSWSTTARSHRAIHPGPRPSAAVSRRPAPARCRSRWTGRPTTSWPSPARSAWAARWWWFRSRAPRRHVRHLPTIGGAGFTSVTVPCRLHRAGGGRAGAESRRRRPRRLARVLHRRP